MSNAICYWFKDQCKKTDDWNNKEQKWDVREWAFTYRHSGHCDMAAVKTPVFMS